MSHADLARALDEMERALRFQYRMLDHIRAQLGTADTAEGRGPVGQSRYGQPSRATEAVLAARASRRESRRRRRIAAALVALTLALAGAIFVLLGRDDAGADTPSPSSSSSSSAAASDPHAGHDMGSMDHSAAAADPPQASDGTAPAATAASAGDDEPIRLAPGSDVAVELGDFFVKSDYNKVRAGEITFTIDNTGGVEHEFMIARTEDLPIVEIPDMTSDQVHHRVTAMEHGIAAGSTGTTMTVDLTPGKYVLFCNMPGHFGQGQYVTFRVA